MKQTQEFVSLVGEEIAMDHSPRHFVNNPIDYFRGFTPQHLLCIYLSTASDVLCVSSGKTTDLKLSCTLILSLSISQTTSDKHENVGPRLQATVYAQRGRGSKQNDDGRKSNQCFNALSLP